MRGIEPPSPAWKAGALPLSYTRGGSGSQATAYPVRTVDLPEISPLFAVCEVPPVAVVAYREGMSMPAAPWFPLPDHDRTV